MKRRFLQKRVLSSVQSSSMHSSSLQKRLIEGKRGYSATTTIIPQTIVAHPPKTANNLFREIYLDFSGRLLWMGGWFQSCVHRCLICEKWCWAISSVLTTIAVPFWQNTVLMKCLFGGGGVWGAGHKKGLLAIWKRIFAKIAELEKWRTLGFCKINLMQWHPQPPQLPRWK